MGATTDLAYAINNSGLVGGQNTSADAWTYDTVSSTSTDVGAKINSNPFGTGSIGTSVANAVSNRYNGTLSYVAGAVQFVTSSGGSSSESGAIQFASSSGSTPESFGFVWMCRRPPDHHLRP